jgi:hypothetical protein
VPQDAEVQKLLVEVLTELKDAVKEHDERLRSIEVAMARWVGGLGVLTFLIGGGLALMRRI